MLYVRIDVYTFARYDLIRFFCVLKAYDQHLNIILGDVEETVTTTEIDEETFEEIIKVGFE